MSERDRLTRIELDFERYAVSIDSGCIVWTGSIDKEGYGRVWVRPGHQAAHRYSWEWLHGPVPQGKELDHICRVRACVNARHLEPVTHAENVRRGLAVKQFCTRGHLLSEHGYWFVRLGRRFPVRRCRTCRAASDKLSRNKQFKKKR